MELRISCQRCYNKYGMYHVQYLQQQLLRSYLSAQLRRGPSHLSVFRSPLGETNKKDQRATYSIAARVICTAVAVVMELRVYCQHCYVRYVPRTLSIAAAQRKLRVRAYSLQHRMTARVICTAAVVVVVAEAAVMELRMSCQRCHNAYGMYHVQYLQQQLLRSHLFTQLRCGPSHVSVFRFPLTNGLCNVRSVETCANAARTHHAFPLQPFTSLENHEGCWRCSSFPTFESFPQQACVYVFPTFFSSVSTRCA